MNRKLIGIIGGVGPYAGLDLNRKIFDNTEAKTDQDHAKVILISLSENIPDRTAYIKNPDKHENPGIPLSRVAEMLNSSGAEIIGMPCNTAHSPQIIEAFNNRNRQQSLKAQFVNMIEETFSYIQSKYPHIKHAGLMSTLGTQQSNVYGLHAEKSKIHLVTPDSDHAQEVHDAIYNLEYGIKAFSNPVTEKAKSVMALNAKRLRQKGAQAVILGCTEIPLAISQSDPENIFIDPTDILAQALLTKAGYRLKTSK